VIGVLGAAGTIGRLVVVFLEEWGAEVARRDARLRGAERVDARDPAAVAQALDGAAVCVNCADYRLNVTVMEGCLDAECHYVDLGGLYHVTRRQLALDATFREAGLTAVLGLGSAPGKTNLLVRAAADRLGADPLTLEIWAATRDPAAARHPFPAPYSVRTLLDELRLRPVVVRDGRVVEVEPLSGAAVRKLPEPVGSARGIFTLHSELATLPAAYPTLREASFRLSLPDGLLERLLALPDGELPDPYTQSADAVAVHLVELTAADCRAVTAFTRTRGGSARSTAEPAARGAFELERGLLSSPGVHAPEAAAPDPEALLASLATELSFSHSSPP
jgi:saccharopine dehydrogenase-like NADP-dependent oxidoreductase